MEMSEANRTSLGFFIYKANSKLRMSGEYDLIATQSQPQPYKVTEERSSEVDV